MGVKQQGYYMKIQMLIFMSAMALSSGFSQTLLPASLRDNLIGEWLFENNGNDRSVNSNHLVINNTASFEIDRYNNTNSALKFIASNTQANSIFNINLSGNAERTISFWAKFGNQGTYWNGGYNQPGGYTQTFVQWGNYSQSRAMSSWSQASGGHLWFQAHWLDIDNKTPNNLPLFNEWRMVTFVYKDSLSSAQEYLNTNIQNNSNLTLNSYGNEPTLATVATPLSIIGSAGDFIDDVRIFDRALTPTEIGQLYLAVPEPSALSLLAVGLGGLAIMRRRRFNASMIKFIQIALIAAITISTSSASTLVGWFKFDDSANLGLDSSGKGNNGVVVDVNGGIPTYASSGYTGGAAMFNGSSNGSSSGGLINIPINANPLVMPKMTWGIWVKPSVLTANTAGSNVRNLISIDNGDWDRAIAVDNRFSGSPAYGIWNGVWAQSLGLPVTTNWTFLAVTYNNNHYGTLLNGNPRGLISVYLNGVLQTTFESGYGSSSATSIALGANPAWQSSPVEMFNGLIDNVFVYDDSLSPTQVAKLNTDGSPVSLVPEPSTGLLFMVGMAALLSRRNRE